MIGASPVRIAVIGCGDVAVTRHLPAIAGNPDVQLVATCDSDLGRAQSAAAAFGATYATSEANAVLDDREIDAVIIATPPWVTPNLTIAALRAGKDVLAEKPMALTMEEARAVQAAEQSTDRFVQIGFVMRHGPMFGTLRRWIIEDRLGSPLTFRIGVFDEIWDPIGDPEHYQRIMHTLEHGAPFIHDGAHTMDHLNYLLDSPATQMISVGQKTRPEFPADNLNLAVIEFAGGHIARVEIGWFLSSFPRGEWDIIGPRGRASFLQTERKVVLSTPEGDESVSLAAGEDWFVSCFQHQLATFADAVRSRIPPEPGTAAGIASLALTQAFARGMESPFMTVVPERP